MELEKIYEIIAKKHGISVQEVKDEMSLALRLAWENREKKSDIEKHQKEISPGGEVPTTDDFIRIMANKFMEEYGS